MKHEIARNKVLGRPDDDHLVQFYGDDENLLAGNVTKYLAEGLRQGEGAIVIATLAHTDLFCRRLGLVDASHRIVWLDAERTLAEFMSRGMPDWERFQKTIVPVIQDVRAGTEGVRAYGEMVGLLWTAGMYAAAIRLEQYWNRLLSLSSFNLFCGYAIDVLSKDFDPAAMDAVLCNHTHVVPAGDRNLEASICQALEEVLGSKAAATEAAMRERLFGVRWGVLPRSEGLILWLRQNLAAQADEVLDRARFYSRPAAV
jgi:hypothetical protein